MTDFQFSAIKNLFASMKVAASAVAEKTQQYVGKAPPSTGAAWTQADADKLIAGLEAEARA